MATRSIYHKACPSCAALVAADAKQCECGYSFEAPLMERDSLPAEQTLQEEELVREYLSARVGQAVVELQQMQSVLVSDPKNIDKANKLLRAFTEMRALSAELDAQAQKIAELKKLAGLAPDEPEAATERAEATTTDAGSSQPTTAFRAAQAAKLGKIMQQAGMDTKECPKCHAVLPKPAALCFCGYAFAARDSSARPSSSTATTIPLSVEPREAP